MAFLHGVGHQNIGFHRPVVGDVVFCYCNETLHRVGCPRVGGNGGGRHRFHLSIQGLSLSVIALHSS